MRKYLLITALLLLCHLTWANHITGGEMFYKLKSFSGNSYTYEVTLKLYRDCNSSGAQLDASVPISIFDAASGATAWFSTVQQTKVDVLNLGAPSPCIQNPPPVCYQVGFYVFNVTLPGSAAGYIITYQRCCRIAGINNLLGSSAVGATYTATIPGTVPLASGPQNNSARFIGADTVIVCANTSFCYNFGAVDDDAATLGDSLGYSFAPAYVGGSQGAPIPNPPSPPPYTSVPYAAPYDFQSPMGSGVSLNTSTGMMCGIAPSPGIYVVTVMVTEYRNNVAIATQRKDLQIKVGDCNIADAALKPVYISCNGFTFNFANEAPNSTLINSWYWDFGDGATSSQTAPSHTYADTGVYNIKLVVNRGQQCSDSALAILKVFPGFFPGFTITGICANKPTQFTDTTSTRYGFVDSWSWDFGELPVTNDTSHLQNPSYSYPTTGVKNVRFIVTNSKGCIDTVFRNITILDKPPMTLLTKDTLMCNGDTLQLGATGQGSFSWTPNSNIINANTPDPQVFPQVTTTYTVQLTQNGCVATDSVKVRVVNFVTLLAMEDTTICLTDSVKLRAWGNALRYAWTPTALISNPNNATVMALPAAAGTTTFRVQGTIGKCIAFEDVNVRAVPYPKAFAGNDTTICFRSSAQLQGSIVGTSFNWTPTSSLVNANTLSPTAFPPFTTDYVLTVFDVQGCPKPGRDTVRVRVLPKVVAFAGHDTAVIAGQSLQLNGTGGVTYQWSPGINLSATNIHNPVAIFDGSFDSIRYKLVVADSAGCLDSASLLVKIFRTQPQVFVPTAFTPNRDGKNDVFRPIAVGITSIEYFRVFNRWGQEVFSTTVNGKGWDGKINGVEQGTGTFVWLVKAVDYLGKPFVAKGTVTLIR